MKMNDPFGRVSQRQETQYASLREALIKTGVDSQESAQLCLKTMVVNAYKLMAVIAIVTIVAVILLPKTTPIAMTLAGLALLWVLISTINGRKFVKRYMDEELGKNRSDPQA